MSNTEAKSYSLRGTAYTTVASAHQRSYSPLMNHQDVLPRSPTSEKRFVHLDYRSLSRALSDLKHASSSLEVLTMRTTELYNQNNAFLQTLLANNSQLNLLCNELANVRATIFNIHGFISQDTLLQDTSSSLDTNVPRRSSSLPGGAQCSHHIAKNHEPIAKPASFNATQSTKHVGSPSQSIEVPPYQRSPSPCHADASLQLPAAPTFDQSQNTQEKHEAAAVLAASAAAQVVAEQYGLPSTDHKFYNKVLMKLLSPQPSVHGGNWNPSLVSQANNIDVFKDTMVRSIHLASQPDPKATLSLSDRSANRPSNNHPHGTIPSIRSPVGPGATLTFKSARDTSFSYVNQTTTSMPTDNAIAKMHILLDNVIQAGTNHASPLAAFHTTDAPVTEVTIENSGHEGNAATDIIASERPLELPSPVNENSPYQSPRLLSANPQTLIAKAECSPIAATSLSIEAPANKDKTKSSVEIKAKPPKKRPASKSNFRSASKSRPESKPRSKSRPKSQPISRSSSCCDSMTRQASPRSGTASPQKQASSADTARKRAKSIAVIQTSRRQNELSATSIFNISSDIHVGSTTTASSLTSMSLSTIGTRPGTKPLSRASSQPLTATRVQSTSDRARVNKLLEKYSATPSSTPKSKTVMSEETSCQRKIDYQQSFTTVVSFMQFFLDSGNCDPLSPLPTNDLLTSYATALCEKMSQISLDSIGKDLIRIAEWMAEQLSSEHFFEYITSESFIADYFTHIPKTLPEISAELTTYNRRRKEDYNKSLVEYEIERKKGSPRLKYMEKPEEPKRYTMDQFHTAFKRSLRNMWSPELEHELIYYFHGRYMDMTATEGIILQEWIDHDGDLSKSIFPGHNLYNYTDFFNRTSTTLSKMTEDSSISRGSAVSYDLYFYYCLLSVYLLLNDCFPIKFNIYYMNYKMFQGVFRYISPADLEMPMSMGSNFRLYWPAWKDVRRGTLRFHCKFLEIKRAEKPARAFLGTTGSFSK